MLQFGPGWVNDEHNTVNTGIIVRAALRVKNAGPVTPEMDCGSKSGGLAAGKNH
jgi:hypothetical protein